MIMDFRAGSNGGPRSSRGCPLLNGYSGGDSVDGVNVRLVKSPQKLAGIAAEAFNVASLAFRIKCVERERAFSRSRQSRNHRPFPFGDGDGNVLQVVHFGTFDLNVHSRLLTHQRYLWFHFIEI